MVIEFSNMGCYWPLTRSRRADYVGWRGNLACDLMLPLLRLRVCGQGPGEVGVRAEGQTVRFVRCQGSRGGYQGADRPRLERRERREADSCRHGRRFIGGRMWRGRPVERHYAAACRARRKRTGRPVAWRTVGKLGATARRVRYRMIGDINDRPDVLIVCVGGNDMLAGRSVREWAAGLAPVLDAAKNKAGKVMLFSSGQPHRSPVLPRAAPRHRTPHQRADRHEPATVRDARHRLPRPDPYR